MTGTINFTDIHWGKKSDSREHNELCTEFMRWMLGVAKEYDASSLAFLGDWHDSRSKIGVETLNYSAAAFDMLEDSGLSTYVVVGNHDMPYRDSRKNHSLPWVPKYKNLKIIDEPTSIDGKLYVPYIVQGDDRAELAKLVGAHDMVFGHFEFPGFLMNGSYEMPKRKDSVGIEDLRGPRYVFSGHFHARQQKKNAFGTTFEYIGNCFPHDFSDAGDTARGVMYIEDGKEPVYIDWPDAPSYHKVPVTLLADVLPKLGRRATVKAIADVELSKSDRKDILEEVGSNYDLKSFSIEPAAPEDVEQASLTWSAGQDMDAFVVSWLSDTKNDIGPDYDRNELVRLYLEARARSGD